MRGLGAPLSAGLASAHGAGRFGLGLPDCGRQLRIGGGGGAAFGAR